jgi:hypothetical protein
MFDDRDEAKQEDDTKSDERLFGLIVEVIRREKLPALALPKIKMIFEPAGTIHVGRLGYGFTEVLPLVCHSTTIDRGAILEDRQPVIDS